MQDIDKNTQGPKNHVCLLVRTDNATIRIWLICLIMHCFNITTTWKTFATFIRSCFILI